MNDMDGILAKLAIAVTTIALIAAIHIWF